MNLRPEDHGDGRHEGHVGDEDDGREERGSGGHGHVGGRVEEEND